MSRGLKAEVLAQYASSLGYFLPKVNLEIFDFVLESTNPKPRISFVYKEKKTTVRWWVT